MPSSPALLYALSLLLALGGCGGGAASGGTASGAASPSRTVTVAVLETGEVEPASVRLAVGDTLRLRLTERPGTGYGWQTTAPETLTELDAPAAEASGEGLPGGLEVRMQAFRAIAPGVGRLALVYAQPWDPDGAAQRAEIRVAVE